MLLLAATLSLLLLRAVGSEVGHNRVIHERRAQEVSSGWHRAGKLDAGTILPMRIGLKQRNLDRLEEMLLSVSHPDSPSYGKHWTPYQVTEFFSPSQMTVEATRDWLHTAGLAKDRQRLAAGRGWIEVNVTAAEAERLLDAEYHRYKHTSGVEHFACDSYTIPTHMKDHIELIIPTVHLDVRTPARSGVHRRDLNPPSVSASAGRNIGMPESGNGPKTSGKVDTILSELENCDKQITLACLRVLYDITYKPIATKKNTFGIVEYTPQAIILSDLDLFFRNFSASQVGQRPNLVSIDGGVLQNTEESFNFNGESSLDLEYGFGITNPQPITLYQAGDLVEGASFNNLLDALDGSFCTFEGGDDPSEDGIYPDTLPGGFKNHSCGIVKPANVISTSYGMNEAAVTPFYANRQCNEYGKLGLLGTTVIYSSGDEGVAGHGQLCLNPDGSQSVNGTRFNPTFPGGCPFVTSVGATQVNPNASVFDPESACDQVIFSGGGFSNVFPIPSYQESAVHNFLANHPPPYTAAQFNNSGKTRAFPDVSANGANYVIAVDGEFALVFGTSASAPVFASIITLVNDARLALGKSSVGFINPTIYSANFAHTFNDITSGDNPGCGTNGFSAVPGWDPLTGLGTPNLAKLLIAWILLP